LKTFYFTTFILLMSIFSGCSSKVKKKEVVVEEKKIELPKIVVADKGPSFKIVPQETQRRMRKADADSLGVYKTKTHTYLKIHTESRTLGHATIPEIKAHHVITDTNQDIFVRIVGTDPLPDSFTIHTENPVEESEVKVALKAKKLKKEIVKAFYLAMRPEGMFFGSRRDPYHFFLSNRLGKLGGLSDANRQNRSLGNLGRRRRQNSDYADLMRLYSGAKSIRETLQNDRVLISIEGEKETINIADIQTVPLAIHPWEKMIGELGSETKIESLASYIPADTAYLHFHDIRSFVKLAKEIDHLTPVIQSVEQEAGTREFAQYYEKQLVLERTGVAEILGHKAVKDVAIVVGDSFIRQGTDVGIIFRIENKMLLEAALQKFESSARAQHLKMNQFFIKVDDVDVRRIYTDDLSVNQFRATYGEVLILANSLAMVQKLVNTYKKKAPAIKDEGDFRYMRTKYPFSEKTEDGFIFLSDAFIAKVISPQTRIAAARRFLREADLLSINYASVLYGKLEGSLPSDLGTLVKAGLLEKKELSHFRGENISYSTTRGAFSKFGSARMMVPLSAFPVTKVTKSEAAAYDRFQQAYQDYWREILDPIAIQIRMDDEKKTIQAEVRILPIIDSSDYNDLLRLVGEVQAPHFVKNSDGLEWTFAVGKDSKLRKELSSSSRAMANLSVSWLGDWIQMGAADHSAQWDLIVSEANLHVASKETTSSFGHATGIVSLLQILQRMPLHLAFEVSDGLAFAAVLSRLKTMADDVAPGMVEWGPTGESYREQKIVKISGKENHIGELHFYYAIVNGIFVISTRLDYLKLQIDKFLIDRQASRGQSTLALDLKENGWLSKGIQIAAHQNVLPHAYDSAMQAVEEMTFAGKYDPQVALQFRGFLPQSPFDGKIRIKDGLPEQEILGNRYELGQDYYKVGSSLERLINKTRGLNGSIAFDGKKDHKSLLVKMEWKKR